MRIILTIATMVFSFTLVELNFFRYSRKIGFVAVGTEDELADRKSKTKRKLKRYKNGKYKRRKSYRAKSYKYSSSRAMDHRFSNQRSLRRMFRND